MTLCAMDAQDGARTDMPRYVIQRTFPDGLHLPVDDTGTKVCRQIVDTNARDGVTWLHSYVSTDKQRSFCIYDGPSPEAIRSAATGNNIPVDRITEVSVLDPYFYASSEA